MARDWFSRAADADHELTTDAAERLDELDGVDVTDLLGDEDDEYGTPRVRDEADDDDETRPTRTTTRPNDENDDDRRLIAPLANGSDPTVGPVRQARPPAPPAALPRGVVPGEVGWTR